MDTLHRHIAFTARLNSVADRVTVRGACDADTLRACVGTAPAPVFVLSDIEGNELVTFVSETAAVLSDATVLIETHDLRVPGTTDQILSRSRRRIASRSPRHGPHTRGYPAGARLGRWHHRVAASVAMREERDPHQQWLLFVPRSAD
jgi:hypothetical protein